MYGWQTNDRVVYWMKRQPKFYWSFKQKRINGMDRIITNRSLYTVACSMHIVQHTKQKKNVRLVWHVLCLPIFYSNRNNRAMWRGVCDALKIVTTDWQTNKHSTFQAHVFLQPQSNVRWIWLECGFYMLLLYNAHTKEKNSPWFMCS